MITSKELREKWIKFYEERGHVNIGAVSLIGDGTTGVMFNVAGMQPLMPYLLGKNTLRELNFVTFKVVLERLTSIQLAMLRTLLSLKLWVTGRLAITLRRKKRRGRLNF